MQFATKSVFELKSFFPFHVWSYIIGDEDGIMVTYGKIGEFKPSVKRWDNYIERVDKFFIANGINDNIKKKSILLGSYSAKTYQLPRGLSDNQPLTKTYTQLVTLMKNHLYLASNAIAEWFKFSTHDRHASESVAEYVAILRRLSEHCNYRDTLNDMLRDRIVCGIKDVRIQQRLLSEKNIDSQTNFNHCLFDGICSNLLKKYRWPSNYEFYNWRNQQNIESAT